VLKSTLLRGGFQFKKPSLEEASFIKPPILISCSCGTEETPAIVHSDGEGQAEPAQGEAPQGVGMEMVLEERVEEMEMGVVMEERVEEIEIKVMGMQEMEEMEVNLTQKVKMKTTRRG